MPLMSLIVFLIVVGLILYLITLLPIDGTIVRIIQVVVLVVVILYLLEALGLFAFGPVIRFR